MTIILFVYGERLHIRQCPDYAEYRLMKKEMELKNREQQKKLKSEQLAEEALRKVKENDAKKKLAVEKEKKKQAFQRMRKELRNRGIPSCPKCGSTHIVTISKRLCRTIFFDYKCENVKNICQLCGHEFDPGPE